MAYGLLLQNPRIPTRDHMSYQGPNTRYNGYALGRSLLESTVL